MEILYIILCVIIAITSVILTLMILLHKGQGGGMSDMFGGGMNSVMSSSGTAAKTLNRLTVTVAVIWVVCIVGVGLILRFVS